MLKKLNAFCLLFVVLLISGAISDAAAARAEGQQVNRTRGGLAIHGYDPVAYFTEGRPVEGSPAFEYEWNGARYRFASAANRDRFASDPERFAPQYGGFCAYAVSRGYTADIDPQAWAVVDGKLYLNYSKRVQRLWQEDVPGNIRKADANWPGLRNKS
jgi:YHS domain-containing protein